MVDGCAARRAFSLRHFGNRVAQQFESGAGARAQSDTGDATTVVVLDPWRERRQVDLVPDQQLGHAVGADFLQHRIHLLGLRAAHRGRRVDHVQEQIGVHGFFQRRTERCDQRMRQVADEADRVRDDDLARRRHPEAPRGGVEGREKLVCGERARVRQGIEQGRLAGIGIADERDREHIASPGAYRFGVRSNHLSLKPSGPQDTEIQGRVELSEINGSETFIHIKHGNTPLVVQNQRVQQIKIGSTIKVFVNPARFFVYDQEGRLVASPFGNPRTANSVDPEQAEA